MADPLTVLGALSASSQLAQQGISVITFICESYGNYKNPAFTTEQVEQLRQLSSTLSSIQQNPALQVASITPPLRSCVEFLTGVQERLERLLVKPNEKRWKRMSKAFSATKSKTEIVELFNQIEQRKGSLLLAVSEVDISQGHATQTIVQGNTVLLETLHITATETRDVLSTMRRETTPTVEEPKRYYSVPARRVRNFVGRDDILESIEAGFFGKNRNANGPHVVVLRGLGGQGKTQIALEYCRRSRLTYRGIFWVDANSESTVKESFQAIADKIKAPEEVVPTDATNFVLEKLNLWDNPWLMVFDNYDDVKNFDNIQDFLSDNDKGRVIVTSRSPAAETLAREDCALHLEGLPKEYALELLQKTSLLDQFDSHLSEASQIVHKLVYHPLAITQAGSYIQLRKLNLDQFLEHYVDKRKILEHTPLVTQYRKRLNKAEKETAMNVFTTWELSFEQLVKSTNGVEKGDLLTLFAFFDNKDISEQMFKAYCNFVGRKPSRWKDCPWPVSCLSICLHAEDTHRDSSSNWDSQRFRGLLEEFAQTSLVQSWSPGNDDFCHLSIHPLVQDWIRFRLNDIKSTFCALLAGKILMVFLSQIWRKAETRNILSLPTQQTILSHVEVYEQNRKLLDNRPTTTHVAWQKERLDYSDLWVWVFFERCGRYNEAERLALRIYELRLQYLGLGDKETISGANELANAYVRVGKLELSEKLMHQVLEFRRKLNRSLDQETLVSQRRLAKTLILRGRYKEAEEMARELLKAEEDLLGPEHGNVLSSLSLLAAVLGKQKKYDEAEIQLQRVLECRERIMGANHVDTLVTVGRLGRVYQDQGKLDLAEQMMRRDLVGSESIFGREHPSTMARLHNMAFLLWEQGKLDLAEETMNCAVEGSERSLGKEHIETLNGVAILAAIVEGQGRHEEAVLLSHRALLGQAKVLGPEHPRVIRCAEHHIHYMKTVGKRDEAVALVEELQISVRENKKHPKEQERIVKKESIETEESSSIAADPEALSLPSPPSQELEVELYAA